MADNFLRILCLLIFLHPGISSAADPQKVDSGKIKLGAYYFDGWTGKTRHITDKLKAEFPERKPLWGWVTSTPEIMEKQINAAANAGISFFCFDWYYSAAAKQDDPKNNALKLFIAAQNHTRMQFSIVAINHQGYDIGPDNWDAMSGIWISLMQNPSYLRVDNKPLLIFFSSNKLIEKFGSAEAVHAAMDKLRKAARDAGVGEIVLATCASPDTKSVTAAKDSGFEMLTGYNYHNVAFQKDGSPVAVDINKLIEKEPSVWNKFIAFDLPYIPVSTLGFDSRPQIDVYKDSAKSSWYVGYSPQSVYASIHSLKSWMLANPSHLTHDKLALVYAWNENAEGPWLTPSDEWQYKLLESVSAALK